MDSFNAGRVGMNGCMYAKNKGIVTLQLTLNQNLCFLPLETSWHISILSKIAPLPLAESCSATIYCQIKNRYTHYIMQKKNKLFASIPFHSSTAMHKSPPPHTPSLSPYVQTCPSSPQLQLSALLASLNVTCLY